MEPGKVGPGGAATSEGVLASFFNSLLSKKTGQGGLPGQPGMPGAPGMASPSGENCKCITKCLSQLVINELPL